MNHVRITDDDWVAQFEPVKNALADDDSWDGCLFDTSGPDYERVQQQLKTGDDRVWTLLDVDGRLVIANGWHYVNRLGYFITKNPAQPETDYEIYDPDDEEQE